MGTLLPYSYVAIVLVEAMYLLRRYTTDPPAAGSAFSVNLGWLGLISMVVMLVYSVARRYKPFRDWARLSRWLHFHIFCGVQGVLFVFFHCWNLLFEREAPIQWLNPGVVNLIAVTIVFFSGIFGRYLYSRLPGAIRENPTAPREQGLTDKALEAAEKVFRQWIILHRPLASAMYVLSVMHVVLAYMFSPMLGR